MELNLIKIDKKKKTNLHIASERVSQMETVWIMMLKLEWNSMNTAQGRENWKYVYFQLQLQFCFNNDKILKVLKVWSLKFDSFKIKNHSLQDFQILYVCLLGAVFQICSLIFKFKTYLFHFVVVVGNVHVDRKRNILHHYQHVC